MNAIPPDAAAVWQALATIPDPEFGVSIVDLGLIYSVECDAGRVRVAMTLTTPACPSAGWMQQGAANAVRQLPGVDAVQVDLVFEPRWNAKMLSVIAREQLGIAAEA